MPLEMPSLAVEWLAGLVNYDDKRLARLGSKDLLDYHVKLVEMQNMEARIGKE